MMDYSSIRLKNKEIDIIKNFGLKYFNSLDIWIFGSRIDVKQKGGDIDIYIETEKKDDLLKSKIIFLREFDKEFGEQKIDLIINDKSKEKEIYKIAKQGIKL